MFGTNSQKLLLLFKFPQGQTKGLLDQINLSARLFGILSGLKSVFGLEAAVHHIGEEINFYIAIPKKSIEFVGSQIKDLWKDAEVESISDYNIFNFTGANQGVYFKQKFDCALPIRTFSEASCDVFIPIVSRLSRINEIGEGVAIQILVKPSRVKTKKQGPLLSVNLRILASAVSQYEADAILENISSGFLQFSAPQRQELKIIKPRNSKDLISQFSSREFDDSQSMILNIEELVSLFHF